MTQRSAVAEIETFSEEEVPTTIFGGDRPTPVYEAPANLVRFSRPHEGSVVAPLPTDSGVQPLMTPPEPRTEPGAAGEAHESEFWDSAPRYSTTSVRPAAPVSLPPRQEPSRARRLLAKALFGVAFAGVLGLLAYEACLLRGINLAALLR